MTIEELKELKKTVRAGFYVDDTDGDEDFFRVINQSDEIKILELIDEKISQLSVTDEDVREAINDVECSMHETYSQKLAITALQQMRKEPCEYCRIIAEEGLYRPARASEEAYEMVSMPCLYCSNCGRKLR